MPLDNLDMGPVANQPLPHSGNRDKFWWSTDTQELSISDGTTWTVIGSGGGGGGVEPIHVYHLPESESFTFPDPQNTNNEPSTILLSPTSEVAITGDGVKSVLLTVALPWVNYQDISGDVGSGWRGQSTILGLHDGVDNHWLGVASQDLRFSPDGDDNGNLLFDQYSNFFGQAIVPPFVGPKTFTLSAYHFQGLPFFYDLNINKDGNIGDILDPFISAQLVEVAP